MQYWPAAVRKTPYNVTEQWKFLLMAFTINSASAALRFYAIQAGVDVHWSLSIIHPSWVEKAAPLRIPFGRRRKTLFPFAIQIEANWAVTSSAKRNSYMAIDDISLSVECFDKAAQLSPAGNWTSLSIDSCNSTGTQRIRQDQCRLRGHRHGPYQFLSVDDQRQIWTVPETLLYRLTACGAEGGSFPFQAVENGGGCVTVDIKLVIGTKLQVSVGQKGESPCDRHVKSSMQKQVLESLCHGQDADQRLNTSLVYGAGGGGATTVSVNSVYIIVAGGGVPAGGLPEETPSKGKSHLHEKAGISVSLPTSAPWFCDGYANFGGVAVPCEPVAGGGGGYYGRKIRFFKWYTAH
ncbi:hypothetical protein COOONC_25428 [Cooperia oncophora]